MYMYDMYAMCDMSVCNVCMYACMYVMYVCNVCNVCIYMYVMCVCGHRCSGGSSGSTRHDLFGRLRSEVSWFAKLEH